MKRDLPQKNLKPYNVKYIVDPTQEELKELALKYTPCMMRTKYGNLNKISRCKARKAKLTYIIGPESDADKWSSKMISPEKAEELIERQRRYIEDKGTLIVINGYEGIDREFAVPVQWMYTPEGANIAGMQQVLAFPREMVEDKDELKKPFIPKMRLVMTPGLLLDDMPGKIAIIVDIENYTTYAMGSDYFGESKKGMLRMLNEWVYQRGGLVLHAGAKVVQIEGKRVTVGIMGLSGTGKTTTTFSKQGELAQPLQDDMVCFWRNGKFSITENGCFAKTFGLKLETEPIIYKGTISKDAWVENVFVNEDGTYDFSKEILTPDEVKRYKEIFIETGNNPENIDKYIRGEVKAEDVINEYKIPQDGWDFVVWTQNGRSIIPMSAIEGAADLREIPQVKYLGILNRDEGPDAATPGIVLFSSPEQAAGYFMLGETSKTSATGKERGKTRSPFTQDFFPRALGLQAERFAELAKDIPDLKNWMMNTGYIGGDELDEKKGKALKVKIKHSSAMLEFMFRNKIVWKKDPDFGYLIVDTKAKGNEELLKLVPPEILEPIIFYEKTGRLNEYKEWVKRIKEERRAFLKKYNVSEYVIKKTLNE
uniref:phosphoenolpyruvate carboxykinase (ATP) n=1 Tax=candidate division WOR-3 bacterium TaxID=2052148 RepID=A0A7C4YG20_UNCW3